mmetsp:Transcript_19487/g.44224  ORF Transcript_19487/g.44224 Transcript_19487/m.44224 type:complete len:404 (+) Transcript_19487:912-2123(+)
MVVVGRSLLAWLSDVCVCVRVCVPRGASHDGFDVLPEILDEFSVHPLPHEAQHLQPLRGLPVGVEELGLDGVSLRIHRVAQVGHQIAVQGRPHRPDERGKLLHVVHGDLADLANLLQLGALRGRHHRAQLLGAGECVVVDEGEELAGLLVFGVRVGLEEGAHRRGVPLREHNVAVGRHDGVEKRVVASRPRQLPDNPAEASPRRLEGSSVFRRLERGRVGHVGLEEGEGQPAGRRARLGRPGQGPRDVEGGGVPLGRAGRPRRRTVHQPRPASACAVWAAAWLFGAVKEVDAALELGALEGHPQSHQLFVRHLDAALSQRAGSVAGSARGNEGLARLRGEGGAPPEELGHFLVRQVRRPRRLHHRVPEGFGDREVKRVCAGVLRDRLEQHHLLFLVRGRRRLG